MAAVEPNDIWDIVISIAGPGPGNAEDVDTQTDIYSKKNFTHKSHDDDNYSICRVNLTHIYMYFSQSLIILFTIYIHVSLHCHFINYYYLFIIKSVIIDT